MEELSVSPPFCKYASQIDVLKEREAEVEALPGPLKSILSLTFAATQHKTILSHTSTHYHRPLDSSSHMPETERVSLRSVRITNSLLKACPGALLAPQWTGAPRLPWAGGQSLPGSFPCSPAPALIPFKKKKEKKKKDKTAQDVRQHGDWRAAGLLTPRPSPDPSKEGLPFSPPWAQTCSATSQVWGPCHPQSMPHCEGSIVL